MSIHLMTLLCCAALLPLRGALADEGAADPATGAPVSENSAATKPQPETNPMVILKTTHGDIQIELFAQQAPDTVANFLQYVADGHYRDTIFHRVIDGFMIQGGGFTKDMAQKPTRAPVKNEAGNGLKNERGTLAMARTGDPHSASAQFFINLVNNAFLDFKSADPRGYGYCVFGRVVNGMDVVDKIKGVRTATRGFHENVPVEPVVILEAAAETAD